MQLPFFSVFIEQIVLGVSFCTIRRSHKGHKYSCGIDSTTEMESLKDSIQVYKVKFRFHAGSIVTCGSKRLVEIIH